MKQVKSVAKSISVFSLLLVLGAQSHRIPLSTDLGEIAVIQDDGTIVLPPKSFDLQGQTIIYTPNASGYDVSLINQPVDDSFGQKLTQFTGSQTPLDDGFGSVPFGFRFPFYGVPFTSSFVGTNGNLTFLGGDSRGEAAVVRFLAPLPRIAAFWNDFDLTPVADSPSAGIFVKQLADRLVVTYREVPLRGRSERNSFQATLFADGRITVNYFQMQSLNGLIGLSPGSATRGRSEIDFSASPQPGLVGAVYENFRTQMEVDLFGVISAFYRTHGDDFDFLYFWTDFDYDLQGAGARYLAVRSNTQGLGIPTFDFGTGLGLPSRLQGFLEMNNILSRYPADPHAHVLGGLNSALSILGQEQGHRWMSFLRYPGSDPAILLGRDANQFGRGAAHWNFFLNTESASAFSGPAIPRASSVEGNVWIDNGDGTFSTPPNELTDGYSPLDQYLMGLRAPEEVPDTFVITNPTVQRPCFGTAPEGRDCRPEAGFTTGGRRLTVTISQIIQANGPRVPGVQSSQKEFRGAFILLVRRGALPAQSTLDKLNRFRTSWEDYFFQATDRRGRITTKLTN